MGQQQLLLIVLGLIIIGIAVIVSIQIFTSNSEESAKDAIVSDCITLGAMAQQYFRKPIALGGGSISFANWSIPLSMDTTANGTYAVTQAGDWNDVEITGTPLASTEYSWTIVTTITSTSVISIVNGGGAAL